MKVTVVGAGVIGLTCAVELQAAGHDVTVIADRHGDAIVSSVAGAIWFPYRAGPPAEVARWARRSHARLSAIAAATAAAGVDLLTCFEITADAEGDTPPWWIDAAPDAVRVTTTLPGAPRAWQLRAPRIEPARYLPWLIAQLARPIRVARLARLDDAPGDLVVNCTGLGARALAHDATVTGLAGQVIVTEPGDVDLTVSITDDRRDQIFYMIPRGDELVLGGSAIAVDGDAPPAEDAALTARILGDAAALGLHPGPVKQIRRGLRPYRPTVRLERAGRVIHAYGHGGAGYTLAHGCAEDVLALTR